MMQNQFLKRYPIIIALIIYLVVNALFIIKYGTVGVAGNVAVFVIYSIFILALLFSVKRIEVPEILLKYFFWAAVAVFFIFTLILNESVPLESLKVDRLDALDMGIKAVLNGEYPYDHVNRLGNESSNLPVLILTGLPFYLLFGSAVYLQNFCFLLFSFIVYRYFSTYKNRVSALLLLMVSPGYLYELYVKSDLMSNFIIAAGFVFVVWKRFIKTADLKLYIVAFSSALLVLTRIPVILPLMIILIKKWVEMSLKNKIVFSSIFVITIATAVIFFISLAPNFQVILEHNPLQLQNKQPLFLSILVTAAAVFGSFKAKNLFSIMLLSGVLLFGSVLLSFMLAVFKNGLYNTYLGSYFDISHFNMALPFIIISLASGFVDTKDDTSK